MNQTIEHVVLFKMKPNTDQSKIDALMKGLSELRSIDNVLHLTTGSVHKILSSSSLKFDTFLHSRYPSKHDLDNYMACDQHMDLVNNLSDPVCEDFMIVDWVVDHDDEGLDHPPSGSAMRVTFLKLKEELLSLGESEKEIVLKMIEEQLGVCLVKQHTFGENYAIHAKGFSIASLAVFANEDELDKAGSSEEFAERLKEKLKEFVENVFVVDYLV
ncbi:hypothetical protein ACHQM5_026940 [Ranunculus cassubicifolius]